MNNDERHQYKCRKISGGTTKGEALVTNERVCFYQTDSKSGIITEKNHDLEGRSVAGKILIMPSGKGSSVVQTDGLFKLATKNNAPKALIVQEADTVLVTTAIILEIPMVHKVDDVFFKKVKTGDFIELDAEEGIILLNSK